MTFVDFTSSSYFTYLSIKQNGEGFFLSFQQFNTLRFHSLQLYSVNIFFSHFLQKNVIQNQKNRQSVTKQQQELCVTPKNNKKDFLVFSRCFCVKIKMVYSNIHIHHCTLLILLDLCDVFFRFRPFYSNLRYFFILVFVFTFKKKKTNKKQV